MILSVLEGGFVTDSHGVRFSPLYGSHLLQGEIASDGVVRRVEVELGLRESAEATVTPPDFHVAFNGGRPAARSILDFGCPAYSGLGDSVGRDCEVDELELLTPVPRRGDSEPEV